jgi:hypothetical protein
MVITANRFLSQVHMTQRSDYGIFGMFLRRCLTSFNPFLSSAQSRLPIQILDEARDTVQTIHVAPTFITTGSVDGHTRTYDLRKGELRSDFLGREYSFLSVFHN